FNWCHHLETPTSVAWTCSTNVVPENSTSCIICRLWDWLEKAERWSVHDMVSWYERKLQRTGLLYLLIFFCFLSHSMVTLPDQMPASFHSTYTPIAAAGTSAQIHHLARMLAVQLTVWAGEGGQYEVLDRINQLDIARRGNRCSGIRNTFTTSSTDLPSSPNTLRPTSLLLTRAYEYLLLLKAMFRCRKVKQNGLPRSILVLLLIDGYLAFAEGDVS
ncbi:unnamed protein product, partial [Schistosoma margrebowiei]